mmetsp:Transcript_11798/g.19876  ORF Transcript_11798/g.19876 Transcript_11798/m.19876 type:complete len:429 (+) Transcript_11798:3-1289(+)|eukprot:CAMPEP_0119332614 /NCGR_PEP_ID=MMETSP1333-20130426/83182_1 /TAXON_ID=418940 /ORGANISM="Scyphosphaera apsteinii, Strain RCC1455" /LENGTH=428 /DNA_ID=CAMNT_0007342477 /DNA_START=1 /DNA_END=1287 /DNA_ORIENTATION=+
MRCAWCLIFVLAVAELDAEGTHTLSESLYKADIMEYATPQYLLPRRRLRQRKRHRKNRVKGREKETSEVYDDETAVPTPQNNPTPTPSPLGTAGKNARRKRNRWRRAKGGGRRGKKKPNAIPSNSTMKEAGETSENDRKASKSADAEEGAQRGNRRQRGKQSRRNHRNHKAKTQVSKITPSPAPSQAATTSAMAETTALAGKSMTSTPSPEREMTRRGRRGQRKNRRRGDRRAVQAKNNAENHTPVVGSNGSKPSEVHPDVPSAPASASLCDRNGCRQVSQFVGRSNKLSGDTESTSSFVSANGTSMRKIALGSPPASSSVQGSNRVAASTEMPRGRRGRRRWRRGQRGRAGEEVEKDDDKPFAEAIGFVWSATRAAGLLVYSAPTVSGSILLLVGLLCLRSFSRRAKSRAKPVASLVPTADQKEVTS